MKIYLGENYCLEIDEAVFKEPNLSRHAEGADGRNSHILADGEEFSWRDPKFDSSMSKEDYAREAEALSNAKAGKHEDNSDPEKLEDKIFGWVFHNPKYNADRKFKVKIPGGPTKFNPKALPELVIYSMDDSTIITYMLLKGPRSLYNYEDQFVKELDEQLLELPEEDEEEKGVNTKKNVGDMEVANNVFNNSANTSAAPVSEDYDEDGWHKYKWIVSSIQDSDRDGLQTDNLRDAKSYALEWSKEEPEVEINIYNTRDGSYYLDYLGGKCVRDGWTIKKPKTYRLKGSDGKSYDVKALSKKDAQKALDDYLKKNINESIEKHETLNPKLWGKDEELLPEVREGIQKVVDQFVSELKENEVELKVLDVILVGSNASYNYTKDSDLDVHIVADTSIIPCEYGLLPIIYNMARSQFNSKYDVTIHDVPIEIYVEGMNTSANSNGIYSLNSGWIKKPVAVDIPEIDISDIYPEWEERAKKLLDSEDTSVDDVNKFIDDIYLLRKTSIMADGEYGKGNMVFKEIRNNGYLDKLKELKVKLTEKDMIVEKKV